MLSDRAPTNLRGSLMSSQSDHPDLSPQAEGSTKHLAQRPESIRRRFGRWLRRPETTSDLLLVGKAVLAATSAWAISVFLLGTEVAFMAPWTALLTVHATVHRSLSRGAQTTVSSAIGMGVAFLILQFLSVNIWTFALALFLGMLGARLSWLRDEGVAIATTAIFIFTSDEPMFADRFVELLLGVAIGIAVNMLILPPLKDQQASRYVDSINRRMGAVLVDMADEFSKTWDTDSAESWLKETESMSVELNSAWQTVRLARESQRSNPRKLRNVRRRHGEPQEEVTYEEILQRVDEGISHLRNLTRTLREASYEEGSWDEEFREGWVEIAHDTGVAIADPDATVESQFERISQLSRRMSEAKDLPNIQWPTYGALISSLRHIMVIVDDVASARSARQSSEQA